MTVKPLNQPQAVRTPSPLCRHRRRRSPVSPTDGWLWREAPGDGVPSGRRRKADFPFAFAEATADKLVRSGSRRARLPTNHRRRPTRLSERPPILARERPNETTTGSLQALTRREVRGRIRGSFSPKWACSAVGSAPEWHSGGHRFDPGQVHQPSLTRADAVA